MAKRKLKHGKYILEKGDDFLIFDTYAKKGRAFKGNKVVDIDYKKHQKTVRAILTYGKRYVGVKSRENI